MPPSKQPIRFRPPNRFRLLKLRNEPPKSLFAEYPYAFLIALAVVVTLLCKAGGMSFRGALLAGLWVGSAVYFFWQLLGFNRHRADEKEEKAQAEKLAAKVPPGKPPLPPRPPGPPLRTQQVRKLQMDKKLPR